MPLNFAVSATSDVVLDLIKRAAVPLSSPMAAVSHCCRAVAAASLLQVSRQGLPHPENFLARKVSARPGLRIRFSQHRQRSSRCVVGKGFFERRGGDGGEGGGRNDEETS